MRPLSEDTSPEAHAVLIEMLRRKTPGERMALAFSLTASARAFAMAGLRRRYPGASPEELHRRLAALLLGRETAMKVYGWDPEREGY